MNFPASISPREWLSGSGPKDRVLQLFMLSLVSILGLTLAAENLSFKGLTLALLTLRAALETVGMALTLFLTHNFTAVTAVVGGAWLVYIHVRHRHKNVFNLRALDSVFFGLTLILVGIYFSHFREIVSNLSQGSKLVATYASISLLTCSFILFQTRLFGRTSEKFMQASWGFMECMLTVGYVVLVLFHVGSAYKNGDSTPAALAYIVAVVSGHIWARVYAAQFPEAENLRMEPEVRS